MTRFRILVTVLVLATACTPAAEESVTATSPDRSVSTTPQVATGERFRTVYDYEPGATLSYDLTVDQVIEFSVDGDESALTGGDEALPAEGVVTARGDTVIDYVILPESTDEAANIEILAQFSDVDSSATVDGTDVDPNDYDDLTGALAEIQPIDFRLSVNDRNAVLATAGRGGLDVLSGEVGALTSLSNNQLSRPLGPVFPEDRDLDVGEEWRIETVQEGPQGPIVVAANHRLAEVVEIDGVELLRIETITETDGFEIDFSEQFQSLFAGFASGESGEPVTEEDLERFADVRFVIGIQPSIGTATTLFDPEAGRVLSSDQSSTVRLRWILQTPDEETGEITGFELMLDIDQTAIFELRR